MTVDDATLMAYADGELDAVTARRIEQALAEDAALVGRLAAHRRVRERLATGFGEVLDEPVPDRLAAMLERRVVPLRPAARPGRPWLGAVAAAAALVIGVGLGRFSVPGGPVGVGGGGLVATGSLAATLDRAPSGRAGATRILASFRNQDGRYCRTFSGRPADGIACRAGGDWALVMTRSVPPASSLVYRQAGSANAPLLAAAQAMMAGDPLTPAQERDAVAAGWR